MPRKGRVRRKDQAKLAGFSDKAVDAIVEAAEAFNEATEEKKTAKEHAEAKEYELVQLMQKYGRTTLEADGLEIGISTTPEKTKAKVKVKKAKEDAT